MRAMLVVNPKATTTSARARDVLTHALASEMRLEVVETKERDHATRFAEQAVRDAFDVVVALGGDGTVNEVTNGLLVDGPREGLPALAVVPAGSTNVFARALGMTNDPIEATSELLQALLEGRRRRIGLGLADDRYFTFNAGMGVDAGAVRRVEKARAKGRKATQPLYVRSALREFYRGSPRTCFMTLEHPGGEPVEVGVALVCNTDPWTYLGPRPVRPCPDASFDSGLDVFALTGIPTLPTLLHLSQLLAKDGRPKGKRVVLWHDQPTLRLSATEPLPFQLDGDYLGERRDVLLRAVPDALDVVC
jgi:diacylglycerol kinase family enzyme